MPIIGEIAAFAFGKRDESSPAVKDLRDAGWIACEGQSIAQKGSVGLEKLFNRIGLTWGSVDPKNVFNLPDLRGTFLRGWDNGANVDKGLQERAFFSGSDAKVGEVGSRQPDSFRSHHHGIRGGTPVAMIDSPEDICATHPQSNQVRGRGDMSEGGSETRPLNVNVLFCIYTGGKLPDKLKFFG